jgi:antitoxin component of MazEF toxin-antitoxin module
MEYERKINDVGNSLGVILPADICKYLNLEKGTKIVIADDVGKHGRFISIWNKKQQEE